MDLFLCDEKEDLTFRRFQGMHYVNKEFGPRELDDCVFRDCTFQNADFTGTKLRNVRFIQCVFEDCRFEDVELMGRLFSVQPPEGYALGSAAFCLKRPTTVRQITNGACWRKWNGRRRKQ